MKLTDFTGDIPMEYRPVPFWSWNEKLNTEETVRQTGIMHDAGLGGYFMHARGGLQTEYMGDEWFENVSAAIKSGNRLGMSSWAYDENGWPSGFGGGAVNGRGEKYQQKYLRIKEADESADDGEHTIAKVGEYRLYYEINPFYVDTLDGEVTDAFINEIYAKYYEKYGSGFAGFFTDEPQISRNGIPWSLTLPQKYREAYGDELIPHLPELFYDTGDCENTRFRFWKLVTDLFSANFAKKIYDWCHAHSLKFTGHLVLEETLFSQLVSNGACMPHYEYFDEPGMDWLCRVIFPCLTMHQVSSVAHQLGKPKILSESFALCGHNVGQDALKGIFEWQMVRGITQLCQHLEGYSLRGIRKRDYPPAVYYQQPWWDHVKVFNDMISRTGMLLSEGKVEFDTLLIHPQSSAWIYFNRGRNEKIAELNDAFLRDIDTLEKKHVLFHLGDETIMERHARVENDTLVIGTQRYKTVVLPKHIRFFDSTNALLDEFRANGGKIISAEEAPANNIVDRPEITYTKRVFDDFDMHYFVNSSRNEYDAEISAGSYILDQTSGALTPFDGHHLFRAFDSIIVIDDRKGRAVPESAPLKKARTLPLGGEWNICGAPMNSLTLDHCDYYFDGKLIQKDGYVLNIQGRACELKRPVNIKCDFKAEIDVIPNELYLVCETPEIFDIEINGRVIEKKDCGYFRDKSFRKLDISGYVRTGLNILSLSCRFTQPDFVYKNIENALKFESELNKLSYETEIEAVYLLGSFGVKCDGSFSETDRRAEWYNGGFSVCEPTKAVTLTNIERQGFPFFCGTMKLKKTFNFNTDDTSYVFSFKKSGINVLSLTINGKAVRTFLWEPFEADISGYLQKGENVIELEITNNLRNLLGPHHLPEGESYVVTPSSFFHEPCVFNRNPPEEAKGYCFAEMSVEER